MKLREFQAKRIFREHGISTPQGAVARTPEQAQTIARELGQAVVIKPQLGVKGRGKVGGIRFATTPDDALQQARELLAMTIKGEPVQILWVEQKLPIASELYVAVTVDFAARQPVLMASDQGGVDIETVAAKAPDQLIRVPVSILENPDQLDLSLVKEKMGQDVADVLRRLYQLFREQDAELVEINPLIRLPNGHLVAADGVLNVNDDASFRHEAWTQLEREFETPDPLASEARSHHWTYIDLAGDIGILSSGAGLTMAILDLIHGDGGKPANFLDTAQIDAQGIRDAFDFLARARPVKSMLVNIFAGLNRCDDLATGIVSYLQEHPMNPPPVIRMVGNQEESGHQILRQAGLEPFAQLEQAVRAAVQTAAGGEA